MNAHLSHKNSQEMHTLIRAAVDGDKDALARLIASIKDKIFNLALRMLVDHQQAEDITQDILIKIMTNLSSFRFESKFETWVYRVAANYLMTSNKARRAELHLSFETFKTDLESDLQLPSEEYTSRMDYQVLLNELRISCTMAMLLCLKPKARLVYILGEIFELDHAQSSDILACSPATYRKQLQRARNEVVEFTQQSCGLINKQALCHCSKKLHGTCKRGCVNPSNLRFASNEQIDFIEIEKRLSHTTDTLKTLLSQRSIQAFESPTSLSHILKHTLEQAKSFYQQSLN
ncbi:sigma-70 family RNA polymerase sigma factor [Pseudoalteromonas luteoviolacea]|uniref:RNA polymerase sigma factor n=1 Tax=Pseudoalteromonas luteoviolacea TaxID=43657 RepID=UPI001EEE0273|nr:sigma-70 family RNA polymerase sigma factor [Pseudoalteromonas luteoviolacea]MCF6439896.1 sigma-70 family RNA polymerase sigma factor [Pseudoalteromonas luteoviolacea]